MRVGLVVEIVGMAASKVAVTSALWPPVPPLGSKETVAVEASHLA